MLRASLVLASFGQNGLRRGPIGCDRVDRFLASQFDKRRFSHALTVPMSRRPQPLHRAAGTIAIKPLVRNGFIVPLWSLSKPALGHCCGLPENNLDSHHALSSRVPDAVQ